MRYRSLPVIAVRRMAGNWRLLVSVAIGTVVAAAIISSTAIYSDAIRDLGLEFALEHHDRAALDVHVSQSTIGVDRVAYQRARARIDPTIGSALGAAAGPQVRQATTATFFPTPPDAQVSTAEDRPRGVLRFRSDYEAHVEVPAGTLPEPLPQATGGALPVAIGGDLAERNGVGVGERFDLHPFWDEEAAPLAIEVAAIIEARDLADPYWGGDPEVLDRRTANWETFVFLVPETTLFGAVTERLPGIQADLRNDYLVAFDGLNARNAAPIADRLDAADRSLRFSEQRLRVDSDLVEVLRTFDRKLFFTRIPLLILLLQIVGIVAYYLLMVSTMLVERQASEIALLRSRGATTSQLLVQYGIEGAILAGLAALVGPPLAGAVISTLGPTPAFEALSDGALLPVNISTLAYLLAGGGALIAFFALMIPAWRVTRTTMVEFKRQTARPRPTPLFLRYYLDVLFVLASGVVFWRLSQQEDLFNESFFGDVRTDPFLLLTPAVFLLTVGIVFLRLFPLVLRGTAVLLGRTRSTSVLVGMRSLVRNPTHYTRLILLLMFATGVGMFGASFSRTLDRSYDDRAAYAVGAQVRATDFRGLGSVSERGSREALTAVPADRASPALRMGATAFTQAGQANVTALGVEPESFAEVAFFRDDFALVTLDEIAATLAPNGANLEGIPIDGAPTRIGAWVRAPEIRGRIELALRVRDAQGRYADIGLASLRPQHEVTEAWHFAWSELPSPEELHRPLELVGYFFLPRGSIAAAEGTVHLGAVLASEQPLAAGEAEPDEPVPAAFAGAYTVHEFASIEGLSVIEGYRPTPNADMPVANPDAPPGFGGSLRYSWVDTQRGAPVRGIQPATDVPPMLAYLLRGTAVELELETGDEFLLLVGARFSRAQLAGVVDLFPTVRTDVNAGFALVNLDRLLFAVNHSPGSSTTAPNEAWYATADIEALTTALAAPTLGAQIVLDLESERVAQQEDPLVAAGWQGILAIAFGAVLLLSAIGFLVYSYLTAQERALEFAILRTLGFSRVQIFAVVAFEHLFVIVAGMGLGTVVGLQVGRLMMRFLGTDEEGVEVLPPFILGVSWPSVFLAWGILGAVFAGTIAAVVLLYVRLQVHRALRIGDV